MLEIKLWMQYIHKWSQFLTSVLPDLEAVPKSTTDTRFFFLDSQRYASVLDELDMILLLYFKWLIVSPIKTSYNFLKKISCLVLHEGWLMTVICLLHDTVKLWKSTYILWLTSNQTGYIRLP